MLICLRGCCCNSPFSSSEKSSSEHWDGAHQETFYRNMLSEGGAFLFTQLSLCPSNCTSLSERKQKGLHWNLLQGSKQCFVLMSNWVFGIARFLCMFGKRRANTEGLKSNQCCFLPFLCFLLPATHYSFREICKPSSASEPRLHLLGAEPNVQQEPTSQLEVWPHFSAAHAKNPPASLVPHRAG